MVIDCIPRNKHSELDPLARPFFHLRRRAYYTSPQIEAVSLAYIGYAMCRDRRLHPVWWLPQAVSIAAHCRAFVHNERVLNNPNDWRKVQR